MARNKSKEKSSDKRQIPNVVSPVEKAVKSSKSITKKAPSPKPPSFEGSPVTDQEELEENEEEGEGDTEDGGVDEMGMERLLTALGEDGLDEFALAQLQDDEGTNDSMEEGEGLSDSEGVDEDSDDDLDQSDAGQEDEKHAQYTNKTKTVKIGAQETSNGNISESEENSDGERIPLDEIEDEIDEDVVPRQKIEVNNEIALKRIRESIKLDPTMSWIETLAVTYPISLDISDPDDDLQRELAFYKQALHCAEQARTLAHKNSLPFTRPSDYFAEMVKTDAHMERIRVKLLDETASIKKSEQAKKQRELKKFGKQVQVEKQKERDRSRKEIEEKVKGLKRKRKGEIGGATGGDEDFDIAVEEAIGERPAKRQASNSSRGGKADGGKRGMPRSKRDAKFRAGGGGGRHSKSNTKESTNDFDFNGSSGRSKFGKSKRGGPGGKPKRLGKSRRVAGRA